MSPLEELYQRKSKAKDQMAGHMAKLRGICENFDVKVAVEFGVRRASSTVAMLAAGCEVYSYDIENSYPQVTADIQRVAGDRWHFQIASSLDVAIPECDLLLHDSWHCYDHVKGELDRHHDKARKFLCFHDTISCGFQGQLPQQDGTLGQPSPDVVGILPAIVDFMREHPQWREFKHWGNHSGFLILKRRP